MIILINITPVLISLYWYYLSNTRNQSTTIEIYRPLAWDPNYVNWNILMAIGNKVVKWSMKDSR